MTRNLAVYVIDWSDIQVQANRVSDSVQFATNIGAARSKGFEFEFTAAPVADLLLGLNGSFNDAHVTELTASEAAISGAVPDARLAAPKFQGAAFVQYDFDLSAANARFVHRQPPARRLVPEPFPRVPGRPRRSARRTATRIATRT